MLQRKEYPSDLTEPEWELIKDFLPAPRRGGRPRKINLRSVLSAIFYLNRCGCSWRHLPHDFPNWRTVYEYFRRWEITGVWEQILAALAREARVLAGRDPLPSAYIIDSQSTRAHFGQERGWDGYKKVRGRKRHILVDILGTIIATKVTAADQADQKPGVEMILKKENFIKQRGMSAIFADGGYRAYFEAQIFALFRIWPTILKAKKDKVKSDDPAYKGAKVNVVTNSNLGPKRWIVERTFAWLNHYRRLARDYEKLITHSEAMIQVAMIQILLKRLGKV